MSPHSWLNILDQVEPQDTHQPDKTSALLGWIEEQLEAEPSPAEAEELDPKRPISVDAVSGTAADAGAAASKALPVIDNLASGIAFLTAELQAAKAQITTLERQRSQSKAEATGYQQQVAQLQQANAQLQTELTQFHQAQVQLEPLLKLLQGAHAPVQTPPTAYPLPQFISQPPAPTKIEPTTTIPTPAPTIPKTAPKTAAQSIAAPTEIAAAKPSKRTRRAGETEAKVNLVIDAIIAFNNTPGLDHTDKWAISFPVVKELGKPIGATYQKTIKQVFEERQAEIEAHHQQHGLGSRHNRGKDLSQLTQLIQIDGDLGATA